MSRITRMERFLRDLNFTKSGNTSGVRIRYEIPVGVYETGRLRQVASEVKASNPEIFTEGVYLRQVMKR